MRVDEMLTVYECQKCEQWFAHPLNEIVVHRYDTIRTTNQGRSVVGEWFDRAMVCPECYGGLIEDGAKVGFA